MSKPKIADADHDEIMMRSVKNFLGLISETSRGFRRMYERTFDLPHGILEVELRPIGEMIDEGLAYLKEMEANFGMDKELADGARRIMLPNGKKLSGKCKGEEQYGFAKFKPPFFVPQNSEEENEFARIRKECRAFVVDKLARG